MKEIFYKGAGYHIYKDSSQLYVRFDTGGHGGLVVEAPITEDQFKEMKKGASQALQVIRSIPTSEGKRVPPK